MGESPSLWPSILSVLAAAGGLSALYGVYLNRKQPEATYRLITAQAGTQEAERESKAVEASHKAVESLERALNRADVVVTKLEQERAAWEVRETMLDAQLKTLNAQRVCDEEKIKGLESSLAALRPKLPGE